MCRTYLAQYENLFLTIKKKIAQKVLYYKIVRVFQVYFIIVKSVFGCKLFVLVLELLFVYLLFCYCELMKTVVSNFLLKCGFYKLSILI